MFFETATYSHYPTSILTSPPQMTPVAVQGRVSSDVHMVIVDSIKGSVDGSTAYIRTVANAAELVLEDLRKGRKNGEHTRGWE